MDIKKRKYNLIQKLMNVEDKDILKTLEEILYQEENAQEELSDNIQKELDGRLKAYKKNPEQAIDWEEVKKTW